MNTTLQFKVDNHKISYVDNTFLTTGNKNIVECSFDFSEEWLNVQSFAVFYCGESKYLVEISDNVCKVPNAVLTNTTSTIFSVSCYSGDVRTTNKASVQMVLGGDTELFEPPELESETAVYVMSVDQQIQFIRNNNGTFEWFDGEIWHTINNNSGTGGGNGDVTQEQLINNLNNHNTSDSSHVDIRNGLANKQATLVSGTNIKTINGESLIGSGDIEINRGSSITKLSELDNDIGFITLTDIPSASDGGITVESDPIYTADKPNIALKSELFSGDYNDLSNKPIIPIIPFIPSKTSDLTNDSGFITSADVPTGGDGGITIETDPIYTADKPNIALKSELFSGSYNDLTDLPDEHEFNWRGKFQIGNMYNANDVVLGDDGNDYIAVMDGLVLPPPSIGWDLFLQGSSPDLSGVQEQIDGIKDNIDDINTVIGDIETALQAINGEVI